MSVLQGRNCKGILNFLIPFLISNSHLMSSLQLECFALSEKIIIGMEGELFLKRQMSKNLFELKLPPRIRSIFQFQELNPHFITDIECLHKNCKSVRESEFSSKLHTAHNSGAINSETLYSILLNSPL